MFTTVKVEARNFEDLYASTDNFFFLINPKNISKEFLSFYSKAALKFKRALENLGCTPHNMNYESLLKYDLLKIKHYIYGSYLATFSTLPTMAKVSNELDVIDSIFMKTSMAISTKIMDNINDEWQDRETAASSIDKLFAALTIGKYETLKNTTRSSWLTKAENSALEIASWTGKSLDMIRKRAPATSSLFVKDVQRLIQGQKESLLHKTL
ncbi:MAG: hypothetical protein MUO21_07510, partial [Nitrososphaeraceae archaeon]|nr:hypothetical protein [Nitrososphaeraceae archaeon]